MVNMNALHRAWQFLRQDEGLTTVEYAVAGGLIGLAVVLAFQTLGVTVGGVITAINTAIAPAA
ncbi:MAG: hypothetical protein PVSMB6_08860 [Steroidobacteraceae bacterium]